MLKLSSSENDISQLHSNRRIPYQRLSAPPGNVSSITAQSKVAQVTRSAHDLIGDDGQGNLSRAIRAVLLNMPPPSLNPRRTPRPTITNT